MPLLSRTRAVRLAEIESATAESGSEKFAATGIGSANDPGNSRSSSAFLSKPRVGVYGILDAHGISNESRALTPRMLALKRGRSLARQKFRRPQTL